VAVAYRLGLLHRPGPGASAASGAGVDDARGSERSAAGV
jgi:hypothetical protein